MSDETTTSAEDTREYTPAEIDKMRKAEIEEYKKENAWLKVRVENATLQADLEVQETRRIMAYAQRYQIVGPKKSEKPGQPEGQDDLKPETPQGEAPLEETPQVEVPADEPKPARTLKTVPKAE